MSHRQEETRAALRLGLPTKELVLVLVLVLVLELELEAVGCCVVNAVDARFSLLFSRRGLIPVCSTKRAFMPSLRLELQLVSVLVVQALVSVPLLPRGPGIS
jgi:hypothetical protein